MRRLILLVLLFVSLSLEAQEDGFRVTEESYNDQSVEMADAMRANGKIYVVVAVIGVIFAGIVIYTISVDRKVRKLEKEVFEEKP